MARDVFKVTNAVRRQKHYMRNCLFLNGSVREWGNRLAKLNKYFTYFPVDSIEEGMIPHKGLPEDELNDILDRAKPTTWHTTMLESNLEVQDMSWDQILEYYEKLEMSDAIKKRTSNEDKASGSNGRNRKRKNNSPNENSSKPGHKPSQKSESARKEACQHCGKWHVVPDSDCWTLDKNKSKKPKVSFKGTSKPKASEKSFMTQEQVCNMIAALPMFQKAPKTKRKVTSDEDSESDNERSINHTSDASDSEYIPVYSHNIHSDSNKRSKATHYTTEVIVEILDRHGEKCPIRCLLDTGTSATIVLVKPMGIKVRSQRSGPLWVESLRLNVRHY